MAKPKFEVYYKAEGKLRIIPFETSRDFHVICEDTEVFYGEQGKSVTMLFVRAFDDNRVIMPNVAYQYFRVVCNECGEEVKDYKEEYCSEYCEKQSKGDEQ